MSDKNMVQSIGEPEPMMQRECRRMLKRIGAVVAISVGGLVIFPLFIAPTRLSGASRSARLKWQQRHEEMRASAALEHITTTEAVKADCLTNSDL